MPRNGGVLRVQWTGDSPVWERPEAMALIGDSLAGSGDARRGGLAVASKFVNGAYRFTLRPNLIFHDGSAFTPAVVAEMLGAIPQVTAKVDKDSVLVAGSWELAAHTPLARRSDEGVPVGTGPFRVTKWPPRVKLSLSAYEAYWNGRPFADALEISSTTGGFAADIVELAATQPSRTVPEGFRLLVGLPSELVCVVLSDAAAPILKALDLALDRDSLARVLLQRRAESAGGLRPHWLSGYGRMLIRERNAAIAKGLMGSLRLGPLILTYPAKDAVLKAVAERIAVNARDAGIQLVPAAGTSGPLIMRRMPLTAINQLLPGKLDSPREALDAERKVLEEGRILPLVHLSRSFALASRVRMWRQTQTGEPSLPDVWLDP